MNSIEIKKLSLNFGVVVVLKDLDLSIEKGEFLVLLGASGCGKSTLLNCIAGLLDVTDGQIFINGQNVTWYEPAQRGIGMVFQSYALYPQMTVKGNLSFGLKNAGLPKEEIEKRVKHASEILQIESLLDRKPAALSGGQRQRVAIGRALVRDVEVFLFDEPLSNLDAKLRTELRVEIKRLHQKLDNTMIYVTHDQIEAMTLADRIAVMRDGLIQQLDTPKTIYSYPVNKYVAGFIGSPGMNFLKGTISQNDKPIFKLNGGWCESPDLSNYKFKETVKAETQVWLGIRPETIVFGGEAKNMPVNFSLEVEVFEPMGADTLVWSQIGGQEFRFMVDGNTSVSIGDSVTVGFDPAHASIFDFDNEERL
jgi:multiple sugar transport system ATP-binding protein